METINTNYEQEQTLSVLKDSGLSLKGDNIVSETRNDSTDIMNNEVPVYKRILSKIHTKPRLLELKEGNFDWNRVIQLSQGIKIEAEVEEKTDTEKMAQANDMLKQFDLGPSANDSQKEAIAA